MMYPRLKLARNLLTDDGVIFISIGQEEINTLITIVNEIYGETNKVGIISRIMKSGSNQGKHFSKNIDYILVYCKNINLLNEFKEELSEDLIKKVYNQIETEGERKGEKYRSMGLYQSSLEERVNQRFWIECPDKTLVVPEGESIPLIYKEGEKILPNPGEGVWRWTYERYLSEKLKGNILFKKTKTSPLINEKGERAEWNIYTKIWLRDREEEGKIPVDFITKFENRHSSKELQKIGIPFDFAKPLELIKYLITISKLDKNSIILDFFSGSGTTAHAVMQLNAEDRGNRKYIMVQLPEPCDEKSEAYKAGYKNICEIGKERIRRAGAKIKEEIEKENSQLKLGEEPEKVPDIGFKVFKLDTSNIKEWDSETEDLRQSLFDSVDNIKSDRTPLDVLYEIILKYGLDLNISIEEHEKFYSIGGGTLLINLDKEINLEVINSMCEEYKNLLKIDKDFKTAVILRDSAFKNDIDKTNTIKKLEQAGIKEIKSI